MYVRLILSLLFYFLLHPMAYAQATTIKQEMEWLHANRKLNFAYDAALDVNKAYKGPSIRKMTTAAALEALFKDSGLTYNRRGRQVMVRQKVEKPTPPSRPTPPAPKAKPRATHTLSGYVKDENGETLINATVYDLTTHQGTTTNAYGYFSITLPAGPHELRIGYVGYDDHTETVDLAADRRLNISLRPNAKLGEVVVVGDLNSPITGTQTGKRSLSPRDIQTEFALMSSHDVVKTLQRTSGVAEGMELVSGLYVHGGGNDENLFLIDGTPLYQINHTLGLFSAFNTDVVKNVDFYKSGFPARYGGRLSSVVDVRTNDGDFYKAHGSYRIGLLDGSLHFEGPIRKGKTSYNIGLRRSWIDLISRPVFAIANAGEKEDKLSMAYFFHDLNAKITNIFNDRSRLSLSLYSGEDKFTGKDEWRDNYGSPTVIDLSKSSFSWGNLNVALDWNYLFSPKLMANFTGVYTYNHSKFYTLDDYTFYNSDGELSSVDHSENKYSSTINDLGYRAAFDYRPSPRHHIRFGQDYTWHNFKPQSREQQSYTGPGALGDTIMTSSRNNHTSHEWNVYAEDQYTLSAQWSANVGLNATLFNIGKKTFATIDPRMALKYQPTGQLSFKASYTMMTQMVHKISNSVLELPTDYWVPTTERLKPARSWQVAAGAYYQPSRHWLLSVEGYYKHSLHLLQYASWSSLEPPAEKWDQLVMDGQGRFYGMELDAAYTAKAIELTAAYTLSWNQRRFDDFYPEWYYDKFDNRHKLNLTARWKITDKITAFGAWSFHSGNHITVPTHYIVAPNVPEGNPISDEDQAYFRSTTTFVYEKPNNFSLPAYHRLDLGIDFRHTTKHGHERVWNISLYNVYCHLNSLWVEVKQREDGRLQIRNHAYIPIVPSFSYTIRW